MTSKTNATVLNLEDAIQRIAPYMASVVERGRLFDPNWESEFEETIAPIFKGDLDQLNNAAQGYVNFALDGIRLQKRFEIELQYINKSYEDVGEAVYHNRDYMFNLYLPGILLSHFLWPHHYSQLQFFRREFSPLVAAAKGKTFADVGVGTGFFSRQALMIAPDVAGTAFDISAHSLEYATQQIMAAGFQDRWNARNQDVLTLDEDEKFDFVVSVEVLEHLEDPVSFIRGLKRMLAPGGYAFITAALSAANEDHIHLYMTYQDVIEELEEGGFEVVNWQEDLAYEPKGDEPVPKNAAFVCR